MAGSEDGNVVINYPTMHPNTVGTSASSINPTPMLSVPAQTSNSLTYVKQAPKDTIVFDNSDISAEVLLELYFEDVGGLELASLSRADAIDGQTATYSPIKNLSSVRRRYNPNNIISSASSIETYFSRFGIDLLKRGVNYPYVDNTGAVVIEVDEVLSDEEIEVQILSNGTIDKVEQ